MCFETSGLATPTVHIDTTENIVVSCVSPEEVITASYMRIFLGTVFNYIGWIKSHVFKWWNWFQFCHYLLGFSHPHGQEQTDWVQMKGINILGIELGMKVLISPSGAPLDHYT